MKRRSPWGRRPRGKNASEATRAAYRHRFEVAAAYAYHICQNHPFVDGNKRTAPAAALVFLAVWTPLTQMDLGREIAVNGKPHRIMLRAAHDRSWPAQAYHHLVTIYLPPAPRAPPPHAPPPGKGE
ncbi:MAG: type II toxin-antitoxin system death-on-curing family toxin [Patescibacteria group bacterium]